MLLDAKKKGQKLRKMVCPVMCRIWPDKADGRATTESTTIIVVDSVNYLQTYKKYGKNNCIFTFYILEVIELTIF